MSCGCDIKIINEENKIIVTEETNVIVVSHADGRDGKSAYQQAVEGGYTGTEQEFNCSLSLLADVAEGKKQIADAINVKGGEASSESSFQQLANDVLAMPTSGILANGVTQTEPFSFLTYITSENNDEITEINDSEITRIARVSAFYQNIALREVTFPNLATISGNNIFDGCLSLQSVTFPNLATISGNNIFNGCSSLQSITFPNLTTIKGGATFHSSRNLQSVQIGTLIECNEPFFNGKPNLRNVAIGVGTDINLPFQLWTATNVIAEGQSGIDELNDNLYNNLLTKLYDHSQDGETRTLRLGWLANVTQENIDYANAKGWTLTT